MAQVGRRLGAVGIGVVLGLGIGITGYTFVYAKGWSYLTNDPGACANCHVMQDHYDAWVRSSHRAVAACNDCHVPAAFLAKYWTKAEHGFWHSYGFTTGDFHEPIQIKPHSRAVVEDACRRCHADVVHAIDASSAPGPRRRAAEGQTTGAAASDDERRLSCIRCHRNVGHPD